MTAGANDCFHFTTDIVREVHAEALQRFGGLDGVRDTALLESAVAAPQASIGGVSVFSDVIDIAAAYLFYLCRNHPFLDGNKRAALGACIVVLRLNGVEPPPDDPKWEALALDVASGTLDRDAISVRLRHLLRDA